MPAEIIKVCKEHLPALRFAGKRYTNADRASDGSFANHWGEWFSSGWFAELASCGEPEGIENGYIGLMRCGGTEDSFEYWIGLFLPAGTAAPTGFDTIDLPDSDAAICWIRGKENEGLYAMHDECVRRSRENGMGNIRVDAENRTCFFERYVCPRFTTPDENGSVILDYGIFLAD